MTALVVGRVIRPHGVRGEVVVEIHTDSPEERFAAGSVLDTGPSGVGPLRISEVRPHSGRLLVLFDWAFSYLTYERGARVITGEPTPTCLPKAEPSHLDAP